MSIPLSRLYDHLYHKSNHDILIYGWIPHGSKKLDDLNMIRTPSVDSWIHEMTTPIMIMHDQEPLQFDLWSDNDFLNWWNQEIIQNNYNQQDPERAMYQISLHLRGIANPSSNLYDYVIITHSEQNSSQVKLYQEHGFLPVYFWSHALIAADWFRYAAHDPCIANININDIDKDFLIYNRAWSGSREYRLTFFELVAAAKIDAHCLTSFSAMDDGVNYIDHQFKNTSLSINHTRLHETFVPNQHLSSASADYNNLDYKRSGIEVVLETLFDDSRWHLTEKTLRPIACGTPFILAAAAGSLRYLRSYGFETFDGLINEEYDNIADPKQRLTAIVNEMERIAALPALEKCQLWKDLRVIANRNKDRFFSQEWQTSIENEFYQNLNQALKVMEQNCTGKYWAKSKTMPLSSGSTNRSAEEMQTLNDWIAARN